MVLLLLEKCKSIMGKWFLIEFSMIYQVLNQDETPLLYSLVFGEGVVNDATSVVLFNAIQKFDLSHISSTIAFQFVGNFLYLFLTSTFLGVAVSLSLSLPLICAHYLPAAHVCIVFSSCIGLLLLLILSDMG